MKTQVLNKCIDSALAFVGQIISAGFTKIVLSKQILSQQILMFSQFLFESTNTAILTRDCVTANYKMCHIANTFTHTQSTFTRQIADASSL